MPDAKVPAIGKVNKPTLVIAGIAGVGAAVYAYFKHKKAAAAASTTQASGYGYGYAYGASGYGYGAGLPAAALAGGYAYGAGSYGGYGYGVSGGSGAVSPPVSNPPAASNAQWVQYATTFLVSQGYSASLVSRALNAYVNGQSVGNDGNVVEAAIAFEGNPPVAGPNGYPPSIHTAGSNAGQGGGTTGGAAGAISNLQVSSKGPTSFTVKWNPVSGAHGYAYGITELNGVTIKRGTQTSTVLSASGLHKGWTYNVAVQALPGGPGDNIHVTL